MRANIGGMAAHAVVPDLAGFDFGAMLAAAARRRGASMRGTRSAWSIRSPRPTRPSASDDGLPETLEEVAATYRHRYWKLKVGGDVGGRCRAAVRASPPCWTGCMAATTPSLDGNEQYEDAEGALALWRAMQAEPRLEKLCASILFIEQPVKRARALETGMARARRGAARDHRRERRAAGCLRDRRGLGYAGVSSKACKGVWRSPDQPGALPRLERGARAAALLHVGART